MKTLFISLISVLVSNSALAAPATEAASQYDGLGLVMVLLVGAVCLVIARRRIA